MLIQGGEVSKGQSYVTHIIHQLHLHSGREVFLCLPIDSWLSDLVFQQQLKDNFSDECL